MGDVKERIGGFDARGMGVVGEVGDSTLSTEGGDRTWSVEVGEPRSAATAVSRPISKGSCSRAWSSEYAEEDMDGPRCRVGGAFTMGSSSSVTSLSA